MEKYINQLLEILEEAQQNRPSPRYLELSEDMECLRDVIDLEMSLEEEEKTMETILGVPKIYFPPENQLSDVQIRQLIDGIIALWRVFHYEAEFRKGEYSEREQYTKLVDCWDKTQPVFRGENGAWHIEMYDYEQYWDEDEMRYLTEEEYDTKNPLVTDFDKNEEQPF